jgi:hypothetical protein
VLDANSSQSVVNAVTASGNTLDDLRDESSGCGSNEWLDDTFTTFNESCIE